MLDKVKSWFSVALEVADFLVSQLTYTLFFYIVSIGLTLIFTAFLFENRSVLFNKVYTSVSDTQVEPTSWIVTQETRTQLNRFMHTVPEIAYIGVFEVDLKQNNRIPKFITLENPEHQHRLDTVAPTILRQPAFDYNPTNTRLMVQILNGEFACVKYEEAFYSRFFPEFNKSIPVVCHLSIPPFLGQFMGYIAIGLKRPLTHDELSSVRLELSRLSVDIYLRDVAKGLTTR